MGEFRNSRMQNIIAVAGFLAVILMVWFMYQNILTYIRTT